MKFRSIVLIIWLIICLLGTTACHRKSRAAIPAPPPPAPVPAPVPVPVPVPAPAPAPVALSPAFVDGESAFDAAEYARAARSYSSYLQSNPQANERDRILFRIGVAQSLSAATPRDANGSDTFNQLIKEFPQSPYVGPARVILNLRAELTHVQADQKTRDEKIRQLNAELDRLKKIDLDRRRVP